MTPKHTQGTLVVAPSADGLTHFLCPSKAGETAIGSATNETNAARLALCWNMHDELVGALQKVTAYAHALERAQGADNKRNITLAEADAILAKLDGAK